MYKDFGTVGVAAVLNCESTKVGIYNIAKRLQLNEIINNIIIYVL